MVLETVLDIEFQDMVAGEKAVFYQVPVDPQTQLRAY